MYTTFLASTFRSIRFGLNEAHGKGMALQLNYAARRGRVHRCNGRHVLRRRGEDEGGGRDADARSDDARRPNGDYARARERCSTRLGVIRPEVQRVLDKLEGSPSTSSRTSSPRRSWRRNVELLRRRHLTHHPARGVGGAARRRALRAARQRPLAATARSRVQDHGRARALFVDQLRQPARRRQPGASLGAVPLLLRLEVPARDRLLQPVQGDHPRRSRIGARRRLRQDHARPDDVRRNPRRQSARERQRGTRRVFGRALGGVQARLDHAVDDGANWVQVMDDHGNSGSPAWAIFAAPIARCAASGRPARS